MKPKSLAEIIRLPIKNRLPSPSKIVSAIPSQAEESWSPLRAAQFYSEISKSIGSYKAPSQVYEELAAFDLRKLLEG